MSDGAASMSAGAEAMSAGATQLSGGLNTDMFTQLSEGVSALYKGAVSVDNGTGQVASALQTLEESTVSFPAAAEGIKALNDGFDTLTGNDETHDKRCSHSEKEQQQPENRSFFSGRGSRNPGNRNRNTGERHSESIRWRGYSGS